MHIKFFSDLHKLNQRKIYVKRKKLLNSKYVSGWYNLFSSHTRLRSNEFLYVVYFDFDLKIIVMDISVHKQNECGKRAGQQIQNC